jgi:exodeoxyribonuclease V alpha subunit
VDIVLFFHILQALPLTATLVLVGDADQLPSVGPGTLFRDLLEFDRIPQARLTTVFRQAEESQIIRNAHRINAGRMPVTEPEPESRRDFFLIEEPDLIRLHRTVIEVATRRLPQKYGWDPFEDIQVLTPMHRGPVGTAQLNAELQQVLNPAADSKPEILRGGRFYRVGDKVMATKNNYELGSTNGSLGRIVAIDPEEQVVRVRMEEREIAYPFSNLDELSLGYALSVHKSQGAEFRCTLLILHQTFYVLCLRNLLYTGVTRAKELCVILGTKEAVRISVRNQSPNRRHSGLTARLRTLAAGPLPPESPDEPSGETLRLDLPNEGLDLSDQPSDRA